MKAISYDLCGDDVRQRACSVARRARHFAPTTVTDGTMPKRVGDTINV